MPLPKVKKGENKDTFIDRCMADPIMNEEYDDKDQRYAICNDIWKSSKDKKSLVGELLMNRNIERRFFTVSEGSEVRIVRTEGEPTKIVGYFAKFNTMSHNLGWFRETIEKGFFSDALQKSDTADLFNHDPNYILGRVSSKTLRVWEDEIGLAYECIPPDTQIVRDMIITPIERGDIKGCSFGFKIKRNGDDWDEDEEGRLIRTLKKDGCSELFDGSQVVFPAYPDTDCALRSMNNWKEQKEKSKQDIEDEKKLKEQKEKELRDQKEEELTKTKLKSKYNIARKKLDIREKEIKMK